MRNEPPIEVTIPDHIKQKLAKCSAILEVVFAQDDRRRSKTQLSRLSSACEAAVSKFLATRYPDHSNGPKASKPKLLAGPAKGSYFGIKFKVTCSELQLVELLSLTGETGFLELGKLGSSSDSLRMLFTPRLSAKQPAQPAATASRVYQLRLDNLPEGIVDLPLEDFAAIFGPAGLDVLSLHPVYRSSSQGQAAADSLVVVVKTSVPLTGRRALNISGFPGRTGKVRTHFTVYKYPALPPLAVVCPGSSAAATAAAAASAATKPAAAIPQAVAQPAVQPAAAAATTAAATAMPHAAASTPAHAAAARKVHATPATASSAPGTLSAAVRTTMQSLKRTAPQQQPDDSSKPAAPAASAPPRPASVGVVLPHGPSLPSRALASHSAPAPPAVAPPTASLAAAVITATSAVPTLATSAVVDKPPGFLGSRGGSAFTFQFAAPRKGSTTKHARPRLAHAPLGVAMEDDGMTPAKRQQVVPAAQPASSAADGDAMTEH